MGQLDSIDASEAINQSYLEEYNSHIAVFRDDLIYLHSNLHFVGQIIEFDLELFEAPTAFLQYLANRFITEGILIITRLWEDKPSDAMTLDKLSKWLLDYGIKPNYRREFHERLNAAKPSAKIIESIKRMRKIRNARIAHIGKKTNIGLNQPPEPVVWEEVRSAAQFLGKYFNACSFGKKHMFVPIQFYAEAGAWHEGELGYILDLIALNSKWFELPEKFPHLWVKQWQTLTQEQISEINSVRRRHNMKEIN